MKIGDKITCDNPNAVVVAQTKDGVFIGANDGNLFKVTSAWKSVKENCPWAPGTKIINNHGYFATVISLEEYQKLFSANSGRRNDVFDTMTEPFVTFRYPSGAYGWDPIKYWSEVKVTSSFVVGDILLGSAGDRWMVEKLDGSLGMFIRATDNSSGWFDDFENFKLVRDAGQAFDIGTKLAHIDAPYVHKYTVVSKKEWFENSPQLKPESYHKIYMNYVSNPKDYVFSSMPENYCEVKTKIKVIPTNQPFKVGDIVRAKPDFAQNGFKGLLKVMALPDECVLLETHAENYQDAGATVWITAKRYEVAKPQVGDWMEVIPGREACAHRNGKWRVKITKINGDVFDATFENGGKEVDFKFQNWQFSPNQNNDIDAGKRYFEAYDSNARTWESLNQKYKDKWNNLAKFIANEKKGD